MGLRVTRRRLPAVILLAVSVLAATGCVTSSPRDRIAAAPQHLEDAGTARFTMSLRVEGADGDSSELTGEGAGDFAAERVSMTMILPESEGGGQAEAVIDGTVLYLRVPFLDRFLPEGVNWLRVDLETAGEELGVDVSQLLQAGQSDPTLTLQTLRGVSDDVETAGEEELHGVTVTHYRATVTKERALEDVPDDVRDDVRGVFDQLGLPDSYPLEVWIDGDGFARRLRFSVEQQAGPGGQDATQTVTAEFFDFGAPVDIPLPPDEQTVDLSELTAPAA